MLTSELITEIITLAAIVAPIDGWVCCPGHFCCCCHPFGSPETLSFQPYDWGRFIILVTGVFLEANGIYHFGAYAVGEMVRQKG